GWEIGIVGNSKGVIFSEEAKKATEFILLSNQRDTPLIFLTNTTGFIVGKNYEENGIIKDGAKMINAVANSKVPHITLNLSASFGAGNYGMSGRAFKPRFVFSWPNAKSAVMGAAQLAGVLSIVARASTPKDQSFDEEADLLQRKAVEDQITTEQEAFFMSGRLYDDGVIDPRDTRSVLSIALSAIHSNKVEGATGYGVFRM
ncbi:MAG: acyl-CoA carboxylase subunit beta, partial [Actinomycetota bacterium]|nr:acyl-CoA carboxylase subunit beta [Actinomycetota bacterium]